MSLQKCANLSDCVDRLAHARQTRYLVSARLQPEPEYPVLSMLCDEICLRLKLYLVVKISSDVVDKP